MTREDEKRTEFALRVLHLREAKGWSQTKLAREAGIAPATLSRVLTGDRPLKMEHAVALAGALEVTVLELTTGTTAEGVVSEWVPRSEYDSIDRDRAKLVRELDLANTEVAACRAAADTLRMSLKELSTRLEETERSVRQLQGDADQAKALSAANTQLSHELRELEAEIARRNVVEKRLEQVAEQRAALANRNYTAWHHAHQRLVALERDLRKAKDDKVATGIITAAIAGLAGAMIAAPPAKPKGRSRS